MSILDILKLFLFFYLLFDCSTVNFGPLLKKKLQSTDAIHCALFMFDQSVTVSLVTRLRPWARMSDYWRLNVETGGIL